MRCFLPKIRAALATFFLEQLSRRVSKLCRGAARKTFVPFPPRHLSLDGFYNDLSKCAAFLLGIATKLIVQSLGNIFNLNIGHG